MLYFIFIGVLVIGILMDAYYTRESASEAWLWIGTTLAVLSAIVVLFLSFWLMVNQIPADATLESLQQERASLVYQLENDMYNNDNEIGKKQLMDDIKEFNSELSYLKRVQRDPWVGIFYPNIYDVVDLIELE